MCLRSLARLATVTLLVSCASSPIPTPDERAPVVVATEPVQPAAPPVSATVSVSAPSPPPAASATATALPVEPNAPPTSAFLPSGAPNVRANAAQVHFDEARALMDAGRYAEACSKFEASYRADPSAGALLNQAACEEKRGNRTRACQIYQNLIPVFQASGQSARADFARSKAAAVCGP